MRVLFSLKVSTRCWKYDMFHLEMSVLAFECKKSQFCETKKPSILILIFLIFLIFLWEDLNIFLHPSSAALLSQWPCSSQFLLNLQHIPTTIQPSTNLRQCNSFSDDGKKRLASCFLDVCVCRSKKHFLKGSSKTYHSEKRSSTKPQTTEFYCGGNLKPNSNGTANDYFSIFCT